MIDAERRYREAKTYLEEYRAARVDLHNAELVLEEAQSMIDSIKIPDNEKVQESVKYHDLSALIVKLDDAYSRYLARADSALAIMEDVADTISRVADNDCRRILTELYIKNYKQDDIAKNIGMDRSTVWRHHRMGVLEVWKIRHQLDEVSQM